MTVQSVDEMWSRRGGGYSSTADGKTIKADFTTAYQVVHDANDGEDTILLASSIPQVNDAYPGKDGVYCLDLKYQQVSPIYSIVTAQWSGEVGLSVNDSVLDKPPVWTWTNTKTTEPVDTDAYGFPLCNSNGDPVDGFTKDVSDFTLTVQRNFAAINTYTLSQYLDSVNSDAFGSPDSIWPAGTAALDTFTASIVRSGSLTYYDVTAKIDFRIPYNTVAARAWWYRYRNDGLNERVGTTITFSGGGGTGAKAYATSSSGALVNIIVTDGGRGYTSAPTVSIASTSGGTGASATATVDTTVGSKTRGQVTSVSVGAGGSSYKSGLQRCVDRNGEPITSPVSLKANGAREYNADAAVWIERPKKTYSLPYNALGLF